MNYRLISFLALCLLAAAFSLSAQSTYTVETIPNPKTGAGTGYVSDPDDILPAEDENTLNNLIMTLEDSTTAQVAVVIVQSIGSENPKEFATRLFQYWGIGQAGADNGLLVFTVMDQRRTEFETGDGLEAVLPDAVCYRIGMQELVPYFREGDYGAGLIAAVRSFKQILENPEQVEEVRERPAYTERENSNTGIWILNGYLILNLLFHLGLLGWVWHSLRSKDDLYDKYMALRKSYSIVWIFFFPIPYLLVYFFLRGKLKALRKQPRYSKVNGKPMHRVSEPEDDQYLQKGQVTEEEIGTADYDVWVTDDGDDILILRYGIRHSKYEKCPECGFTTYYHAHTKTVKHPTYEEPGKKEKLYLCKSCGYSLSKYVGIPRLGPSKSSSSWGSSSSSSWSGGSSWSSGGSSGSSSWGGGGSSGGGAGVSW